MTGEAKAPALAGARGSTHRHSSRAGKSKNSKARHPQQPRRIDFAAINAAALGQMLWLLHRLLPGGIVKGTEYTVRNPMRADRRAGSFKINTKTGEWADFALYDTRGGDIVSLVAYLNQSSQSDAARHLADLLGVSV